MRPPTDSPSVALTRAARSGRSWVSAHLQFSGALYSEQCDALLRTIVMPTVDWLGQTGWVDSFFFVRYGEGGPHVRLRLRGAREILLSRVVPALEQKAVRWRRTGSRARKVRFSDLAWIAYEPEMDRYGGSRGMGVAERLADASSRMVLELLEREASVDLERRLALGLVAFLCLTSAFFDDASDVKYFANRYRDGFLKSIAGELPTREKLATAFDGAYGRQQPVVDPAVRALWLALRNGQPLGAPHDRFCQEAHRAARHLKRLAANGALTVSSQKTDSFAAARAAIVPSYVHLTMNRLGLPVSHESYVAAVVANALGAVPNA
jgi:thiopeptide-type bacteriocin biosynthesis protein